MDTMLLNKVRDFYTVQNDGETGKTITKQTEPRIGSTVKLGLLIKDISTKTKEQKITERVQYFQGIVISASGSGLSRNITVRRIASNYIGVEKIIPLYSPTLVSIEVIKESKVRRAKLFYIRDRKGKAAMSV